MPKVTVLPHETLCPEGLVFEAAVGENLARALLAHGVKIEHACEFSCACATCHVIIREGFDSLEEPGDNELDHLDTAWGQALFLGFPAKRRWAKAISRLKSRSTAATTRARNES